MYTKHNNRGWHRRERERIQGAAGEDAVVRGLGERQFDDGGQLTTPVTLTVTVIHAPNPTFITPDTTDNIPPPLITPDLVPSLPPTISILPEPTLASESSLTTSLPSSTLLSSLSTVSAPPTTPSLSIINPTITSSISNIPDNDSNKITKNNPKLSNGAIAGIVIGCLAVLIIAIVFGLRRRSANRQSRSRGFWVRSKELGFKKGDLEPTPYNYDPDSTINGQGLGASMGFTGQPATMTDTGNSRSPISPRSTSTVGLDLPQGLPSAYGSDSGMNSAGSLSPSQIPVLYTIVVSRAFVPTLPDELSISTGETLKVLQVFDDGWAECMTLGGDIGMVPVECFDKRDQRRKSSRYSSLPGARRAV